MMGVWVMVRRKSVALFVRLSGVVEMATAQPGRIGAPLRLKSDPPVLFAGTRTAGSVGMAPVPGALFVAKTRM